MRGSFNVLRDVNVSRCKHCKHCRVVVTNKLHNQHRSVRCETCHVKHRRELDKRKEYAYSVLAQLVAETHRHGVPYYFGSEFKWKNNALTFWTDENKRCVRWRDGGAELVFHPQKDGETQILFDYLRYPKKQIELGNQIAKQKMTLLLALRKCRNVSVLRAIDRNIFICIYRLWRLQKKKNKNKAN